MFKKDTVRKYIVIGAVVAAPIAALTTSQLTEAAIPVIDSSNIAQQAATLAETINTVANTAQQITLQLKELQALPNSTIDAFKSEISTDFQKAASALNSATGVLNPAKSTSDVWTEAFGPAGALTKDNITASSAASANSGYGKALDKANYDSMTVIKECSKGIEDTNARIQRLMELNSSAEGQKQAAQIQNMLLAEQAKLLQYQNTMKAAEASSRVTYYQRLNQIDTNTQSLNDKAAEDIKNFTVTSSPYRQ